MELYWRCNRCGQKLPLDAYLKAGKGHMKVCAECWRKRAYLRRLPVKDMLTETTGMTADERGWIG